jgi:hypothetical protein
MRSIARSTLVLTALALATDVRAQNMLAMPPPDLQGGYIMQPGQELYWAQPPAGPYGQTPPAYEYPYYGPEAGRYPAPRPQPACNSDEPDFYLDVGFVLLWQENTFSNGSTLNFDPGAGPRILLGIRPTPDNALELEYFGSFGNEIDGRLRIDDPLEPVLQLQYTSDLQNAEVNLIHWWDNFALLGGFRFVQLDEDFRLTARDIAGQPSLNTQATNNLFGGQVGVRLRQCWGRLFFIETGKAGLFDNSLTDKQSIVNDQGTVFRSTTASGNFAAFVGDVNVSVGYWLSEHWAVRARYTAMWVSGVAFAPEQMSFVNRGLKHDDSVFLQGLSAGLEARF